MKIQAILVLALALMPAMAFAQGSGSTGGAGIGPISGGTVGSDNPFQVSKSVTGTLVQVADGSLVVDVKGQRLVLKTVKKIHIKSDKNTELASRKNLTTDDLVAGMVVRVTFRPETLEAFDIRITKDRA